MKTTLTAQQRQAVENRGGNLLVSAAAGSGKTKVLVDRLLTYLTDPMAPANIDDFLIITYTKAAAAELRSKIAAKISEHLSQTPDNRSLRRQMQRLYLAKISTVHSFCTDLLREYACYLDIPSDFRVADENECTQLQLQAMQEVLDEAYSNSSKDPDFRAFIDSQGLGRDDRLVPEIILQVYNSARCHLDPDGWLDLCVSSADVSTVADATDTVWGAFIMTDMLSYLKMQIIAMKKCIALAEADPALEKVRLLLRETVFSMEHLAEAKTWDEVIQRKDIKYGVMRFPKKIQDPDVPDRIKAVRDNCKKGLEKRLKAFTDPSAQIVEDLAQTSAAVRGLVQLTRNFSKRYQQRKQQRRVMDFSDLEHSTLDLLLGKKRSGSTRFAREIGQRFREVMVDEYQDTNAVQDAIFTALTEQRKNCFMVGDVKQSIYQFRLADPGIFLEKYESYVDADHAVSGEGRKVLLSQNFRSGGAVLEASNDVFRRCMTQNVGGLDYGDAEALREGIPHEPLGEAEIELHVVTTLEDAYAEEADFVARRITQLLDGTHMVRGSDGLRPIVPDDVVILLRSPGSVGKTFQKALNAHGLRVSFGNGTNLLETEEIGVLRSLLQIISNPRQDIPLIAVMASPLFGFTADELAKIRSLRKGCNFYDALVLDDAEKTISFRHQLDAFRAAARQNTLSSLLETIFCETKIDSIYAAMPEGEAKVSNLRDFFRIAMDFETSTRHDLSQFLEHLSMLDENGLNRGDAPTGGAVSILSIHKSKGLEYPVVFLSGLSRGFNRESLRAQVLCDKILGLGLSAVDHGTRVRYPTVAKRAISTRMTRDSLSEELRVLYVAMTRAKDRLIMTYAAKNAGKTLAQIANSLDICDGKLLSTEVSCPGDWILAEALCRTEAGKLFALAGAQPSTTHRSEYPWRIDTHEGIISTSSSDAPTVKAARNVPDCIAEILQEHLAFQYGHIAATQTPSKQTATQQNEAASKSTKVQQQTSDKSASVRHWRKPKEDSKHISGKEYGTAMHKVMQYIRFEHCTSVEEISKEVERLQERGLLTLEEASRVNKKAILAFFRYKVSQKLLTGEVIREFKFSILNNAFRDGECLEGEKILLQGVVDCALIEEKGITIIDFKTDYVTKETISDITAKYRPQIKSYASALERIYERPVKKCYLYLFHLKRLVPVK